MKGLQAVSHAETVYFHLIFSFHFISFYLTWYGNLPEQTSLHLTATQNSNDVNEVKVITGIATDNFRIIDTNIIHNCCKSVLNNLMTN
jgi:hypothetical protein